MTIVNEFAVWFLSSPILSMNGNFEFNVWFEGAPCLEKGDASSPTSTRRRILIF